MIRLFCFIIIIFFFANLCILTEKSRLVCNFLLCHMGALCHGEHRQQYRDADSGLTALLVWIVSACNICMFSL